MSLVKNILLLLLITIVNIRAQKLAKQQIQSYASCSTDRDCKPNSFCYGNDDDVKGKCKCEKGFELIRNTTFYDCLPAMKIGDACEIDLQCQVAGGESAFCDKYKICSCNEESHEHERRCVLKVKIGELCMEDANCYLVNGSLTGGFGFCTDGHCTCPLNHKPTEDGTKCLNSRKLGEPCVADEECTMTTPNTRCLEKCVCDSAYTESRNDSSCVKAATQFDEPCDSDAQCSKYLLESICSDAKCGCEVGFHGYGVRCVKTRKPGEGCTEDAQCLYEKQLYDNVKCEGTCKCIYGTQDNGSCKLEKTDNSSAFKFSYSLIYVEILFILIKML